jgi:hypothetical protein
MLQDDEIIPKKVLHEKFHNMSWKTNKKMGGCHPEGHIKAPANKRMEENSKYKEMNGGVY